MTAHPSVEGQGREGARRGRTRGGERGREGEGGSARGGGSEGERASERAGGAGRGGITESRGNHGELCVWGKLCVWGNCVRGEGGGNRGITESRILGGFPPWPALLPPAPSADPPSLRWSPVPRPHAPSAPHSREPGPVVKSPTSRDRRCPFSLPPPCSPISRPLPVRPPPRPPPGPPGHEGGEDGEGVERRPRERLEEARDVLVLLRSGARPRAPVRRARRARARAR